MDQYFKHGQRLGLRGIDDRSSWTVPTPAILACAAPAESCFGVSSFGNSPNGEVHEKTPCSSRPIRFSTSRAPTSVREYSRGVSFSSALFGVVSHLSAPARSPSNNSRVCSKMAESRSSFSDSSELKRPDALRRAKVRGGKPTREAISGSGIPERDSSDSMALKENPRPTCLINSRELWARKPKLPPGT